jgi:uncharacterized membrane protein YfcA
MDFLHTWVVPADATAGPWTYIGIAIIAFLLTSVSKGGFGGGIGILSVPLMIQVEPQLYFVIGMWLPVLIACDIATIRAYPKEWNHRAFWHLTPGMLAGIALTSFVLKAVHIEQYPDRKQLMNAALMLGVGVICVVFLIMQLRPAKLDDEPWEPTWAVAIPIGLAAGITTTIAHSAGPILMLFLLPQKMDQRTFVGTTGRFFFIFNVLKVPFMIYSGQVTGATLQYGLWLLPLAPLGVWLGAWMNRKLSALWFVRIIQVSTLGMAGKMVYDGANALLHNAH